MFRRRLSLDVLLRSPNALGCSGEAKNGRVYYNRVLWVLYAAAGRVGEFGVWRGSAAACVCAGVYGFAGPGGCDSVSAVAVSE